MPGSNSYQNRFKLPEHWTVENFICMTIPVPDDTDYIAIMYGLIDTLIWARSFEQHPTEPAAYLVSKTWEAAFNSRPISFINCEELDVSYDIRVDPTRPYVTQFSTDGGDNWHDALIQPHWESAVVPPTITGSTEVANQAAQIIQQIWEHIINSIDASNTAGLDRQQAINQLIAEFAPYGKAGETQAFLGAAYDAFNALSSGDQAAWLDDCAYRDLFDAMQSGLITPFSGAGLNWLNGLSDWLLHSFDTSSSALMAALNTTVAALGGSAAWNFAANAGGGGGGASFGSTCADWTEFDFTTGTHGFTVSDGTPSGSGITSVTGGAPQIIVINRTFAAFTALGLEWEIDCASAGDGSDANYIAREGTVVITNQPPIGLGDVTYSWSGTEAGMTEIIIGISSSVSGVFTLKKLRVLLVGHL